jgi:alpha,alpha-trehalase
MHLERTPDAVYDELFTAVQEGHIFADSKTFVDAIPKGDPEAILQCYRREKNNQAFDLRAFVQENFKLPTPTEQGAGAHAEKSFQLPIREHVEQQWDVLQRKPDSHEAESSLISLPFPYVVPGGRFREIYYWDSYFTMLGLAASGRLELMEHMVANFAYLIDRVGFIPNGNRNYYCTRSQQPFFALMVELLAESRGDDGVYTEYLPQLEREYGFWMAEAESIEDNLSVRRRVIRVGDGFLNRYWDDSTLPRQESHIEDVELAAFAERDKPELYRDIRAAAESGWDFSTRWFEDPDDMATIRTSQIAPVDLNALMYRNECILAKAAGLAGSAQKESFYQVRAAARKNLLQTLFFDEQQGFFVDLILPDLRPSDVLSVASAYPLFFNIASPEQAATVAEKLRSDHLKTGGWVTTCQSTGQQWDAPNGWAPLQWIVYGGLCNYGYEVDARAGAQRWVDNNLEVYGKTGHLLEKYDVEHVGVPAEGGEYEVQSGFGWTNAVLLMFLDKLEAIEAMS